MKDINLKNKIGVLLLVLRHGGKDCVQDIKEFIPNSLIVNNIEGQKYILDEVDYIDFKLKEIVKSYIDKKILASFKLKISNAESNLQMMQNKENLMIKKTAFISR